MEKKKKNLLHTDDRIRTNSGQQAKYSTERKAKQFREITLLTFALRLALLRSSTVNHSPVTTVC